jgi:hypothetical protein
MNYACCCKTVYVQLTVYGPTFIGEHLSKCYHSCLILGIFGGLDLHGKPRNLTWTRLAATANKGANQIQIADGHDWQVGEDIVIAPTGFEASECETARITAVSGQTLTLNKTLAHTHIGKLHLLNILCKAHLATFSEIFFTLDNHSARPTVHPIEFPLTKIAEVGFTQEPCPLRQNQGNPRCFSSFRRDVQIVLPVYTTWNTVCVIDSCFILFSF